MRSVCRHIFFVALLSVAVASFSQQAAPALPVMDSVSTIVELPAAADSTKTIFNITPPAVAVPVRHVPKKLVDSLKNEDAFWYANAVMKKKNTAEANMPARRKNFIQKQWFQQLLWILVLSGFLGVVFWYLHSSSLLIFRRNARKIAGADTSVEEDENIFTLHYNKEIGAAEEAKNFRLAVRLHYLQTLKALADRSLIHYSYGRTNSDYVAQLSTTPCHRDFLRLTRNFEYTWYGQFELSAEAYDMMRHSFSTFKAGLHE